MSLFRNEKGRRPDEVGKRAPRRMVFQTVRGRIDHRVMSGMKMVATTVSVRMISLARLPSYDSSFP